MATIPKKLRTQLANSAFMQDCIFKLKDQGHECQGGIDWEHVWIYAGKQIQEAWAILPVCAHMHRGNFGTAFEKSWHEFVSLSRASPSDLAKYPRINWSQKKKDLQSRYKMIL